MCIFNRPIHYHRSINLNRPINHNTIHVYNISSNHLNQVSLEGSSCPPGPLRLPYTLLGESLATVTYLSISNLKTTSQQAVTMFNHMQLANKIKRLSLDSFVDLIQVKGSLKQ